ncbi:MAG: hypothetical protein SP4CHLAM5_07340 [Chlamydiia bacterium]|nr:hypothetical protein [Chlamydiia bacterium]MCH9618601.1 hypothetical protein [Chlamydiia bacterium]MCH9624321.1 hypothetical protein [Chlamydiia bacterium]
MGYEKDDKNKKPWVLTIPLGWDQSSYWRLRWPTYQLMLQDAIESSIFQHYPADTKYYENADVVQIQRISSKEVSDFFIKLCERKKELNFRLVYDVDDILFMEDIPDFHCARQMKDSFDKEATIKLLNVCDEVVTSTPFLREYYIQKGVKADITVIPNRIPYFWGGSYYNEQALLSIYHKHKERPRILYAGGASHLHFNGEHGNDDFSHVIDRIISTRHQFKWVFLGALPWELFPYNQAGEVEFYGFETLDRYPKRMATLQCSMMIAPLMDTYFNHGRTDVKFQEASAHGLPIACQDIAPYKHCPIRFDSGEKMIEVIKETLKDEQSYIAASRKAREMIDKVWLERRENTALYQELYSYPYADKRRTNINKLNKI